jgi:hypothetical protein
MEQQRYLDYSRIQQLEREIQVHKKRSNMNIDLVLLETRKLKALLREIELQVKTESERLKTLRKECAELDKKKQMKKKVSEVLDVDLARKRAQQTQIAATTSFDSPELRALRDIQERDRSMKIYTTHADREKPPIRAGGKVYWSKSKNMWAHYGSGGSKEGDVMFRVRAARPEASGTSKVRTLTIRIPSCIKTCQVGERPTKKVRFSKTNNFNCLD